MNLAIQSKHCTKSLSLIAFNLLWRTFHDKYKQMLSFSKKRIFSDEKNKKCLRNLKLSMYHNWNDRIALLI